ncbi:MAG: GA module-containing protein [Endomicrobium sp.]|jgi:hypothetical protein|nr:GA module-containing protein [Endomicrobium sp.]
MNDPGGLSIDKCYSLAKEESDEKISKIKEILDPLKLNEESLFNAILELSDDGANVDEVIKTIKEKYVDETHKFLEQFRTLSEEEKSAFDKELLADGSNAYLIRGKAKEKGRENNNRVREFKSYIDEIYLSEKRKQELKTIVNGAGTNIEEILVSIVQDQRDRLGNDIKDMLLSDEQKEELKKKINTKSLLKTEADYQEILNGTKSLREANAIDLINTLDGISSTRKEDIKDSIKQGTISPEEGLNSAKKTAKAIKRISKLQNLNDEEKENLYKRINPDASNINEVIKEAEDMNSSRQSSDGDGHSGGDETPDGNGTASEDEKVKTEVIKEGKKGYIIIESNEKIGKKVKTIEASDIEGIGGVEVRGSEVFLHEVEYKEGKIEIKGYGEYGLLPELKGENEKTIAKIFDRALEGRRSEEEESGENDRAGGVIMTMTGGVKVEELKKSEKGRILFEKIGHASVNEAYALARKEISTIRLLPNVIMSVGSEEERKYVYKNVEIKGKEEEEEDKVWIEGINEIKNYGEDEKSKEKYSDNKVGTVIGYGREIGEGKYIGMYMKGSKDEMKQGVGNNGEVVNVGMGFCGGYETSSLPKNSNNRHKVVRVCRNE